MFPLTITVHNIEQLDKVRAALFGTSAAPTTAKASPASAAPTTATEPKSEAAPTTATFTEDNAKTHTQALIRAGHVDWVKEQIKKFGVKNAVSLDATQRAEYMAAALAQFPAVKFAG